VLVVDDLNTMTRIVYGMLRKCGFANVDQVHDGPTALQKLREKSYLFVVGDREMPGMNGLELAREIRADPKIRNVPLVIMSASSEPQHAEAAIAAAAGSQSISPQRQRRRRLYGGRHFVDGRTAAHLHCRDRRNTAHEAGHHPCARDHRRGDTDGRR